MSVVQKLLQSRNGYASQISSAVNKLNSQLSLQSESFDIEYADYLLSKLDCFLNSIADITEQICDLVAEEDTRQRYIEYVTTQKFKIYQVKKSVELRRTSSHDAKYPPSQTSSIASEESRRSFVAKKIKTEEAKRSLLEAQHQLQKAELDEKLELEMMELISENERFIKEVTAEIDQLKPTTFRPSIDLQQPPKSTMLPSIQLQQPSKSSTHPSEKTTIRSPVEKNSRSIQQLQPTLSNMKMQSRESVDKFIDDLVEGQETELPVKESSQMSSMLVIRHEFETRTLPTIDLTTFNGDASQWPEFITSFKNRVHFKTTFNDDLRMERLLSCLRGEAADAVASIGSNGLFYAIALKTLKRDFGNPAVVSHLKLKSIIEKPQIGNGDRASLRQYQQQLKSTVTWLKSIGYTSYLTSTDILTKAVMRLPNHLRQSFFKSMKRSSFEETSLIDLEAWLSDEMYKYFNPIANLISSHEDETKKVFKKDASKFNNNRRINRTSFDNIPNPKYDKSKIKCWLCSNNHRIQECDEFISKSAVERKEIIIKLKLCWNCLSNSHFCKDCSSQNRCRIDKCNRRHHTLLHHCYEGNTNQRSKENPVNTNSLSSILTDVRLNDEIVQSQLTDSSTNYRQSTLSKALLQVIPVIVTNGNNTFSVNALLDSGSDATLIRQDLADNLNLTGQQESIQISNVVSKLKRIESKKVSFSISSLSHPEQVQINNAWVVQTLNLSTQIINIKEMKNTYKHLRGIFIENPKVNDVAILIGADMPELLLHHSYKRGTSDEPIAVKTKLGWVLFGGGSNSKSITSNLLQHQHESLHQCVEQFWSVESFGTTKRHDMVLMSSLEKRAMNILQETTTKINGQYHTGMLWSRDEIQLPNNRLLAEKRLQSIEKRLEKNPELSKKYHVAINKYIEQGHARLLSQEESTKTLSRTNYVPHHCVINPNKPDKVRVVFDAAAKFDNTSLNSNLLIGPDLLNNLISILIRFRTGKIVAMADIEQMFHQIKVLPRDQDSLRFLWRNNKHEQIREYVMTVHLFGKCDSPAIANYALKRAGWDESENFNSKIVEAINQDFYMDDYLGSYDTEEEAIEISNNLIKCLSASHFRLTKWISNSKAVMKSLPFSELSKHIVNLDLSNLPIERTLGIIWDPNSDRIRVSTTKKLLPNTKRGVLSLVSSIFDPLGLVTPSVIEPKLIIQELWRRQIDWDEKLPNDLHTRWKNWNSTIQSISDISIHRWYGCRNLSYQELHIFADASEKAYGAVSYLKTVFESTILVSFIIAKSRLSPIKGNLTIPKLELQAALTATRLKDSITQSLKISENNIFLWSDSKTVLKYIKNEHRRFPAYVMHRVNEIRLNSAADYWKFVPGSQNPADLCTRYTNPSNLNQSNWLEGPEFLYQPNFDYNSFDNTETLLDEPTEEENINISATQKRIKNIIDWERFSSFTKLMRVVAWIIKLKTILVSKTRKSNKILLSEMQQATKALCRLAQMEAFNLSSSEVISDSKLISLRPVIIDGILRVGGRLKNANISSNQKHQIIMPQKHPLSKLIVQYYHVTNFHAGREHTLSLVRQNYWIIKAKSVVRMVLNECLLCERRRTVPTSPLMSDLPYERLAVNKPAFTFTGVDYFGPMIVKLTKQTRTNQRTSKRYGVLFTCLTTRAIHLELSNDLSADSFLLAFRRFCARRGSPQLMWSDNGTNFVGANAELKECLKQLDNEKINNQLLKFNVKWKFNPPSSPWMGGVWEVLVKIVKRALKTVITDRLMTNESLVTLLCEVESMVNSRPLTSVSDDPNDLEAITPNHFLMGKFNDNLAPGVFGDDEIESRKKWRGVQAATNIYWRRFVKEYLPSLTSRKKWYKNETVANSLRIGDLVLVNETNTKRGNWPLARIINVYFGRDGIIRTVLLKTPTGEVERPVRKLALLENVRGH